MNRSVRYAVAAAVLAAICFGTTGTARALGAPTASALSVGGMRLLIGGTILGIGAVVIAASQRHSVGSPLSTRSTKSNKRLALMAIVIGGVGVAAYQPTFFFGTTSNGVAVGTVVALGSAPILTGCLQWIRGHFPGMPWVTATICAVIGLVLLTDLLSGATVLKPIGLLASLGAAASYVCYTICGKYLVELGIDSTIAMGAMFGVGAVLSIPTVVLFPPTWITTTSGLTAALWLGIVTVVIAYVLFGYALRYLPPATVATLTLAEPITATLLGTFLIGEHLGVGESIGIAWILVGLTLLVVLPALHRRHTQPANHADK